MKRIFIIISLLVLVLNSYSQDEDQTDYLDVSTEIKYQNVLIEDWIADSGAASIARNAGNALRLVGNDIDQGGDLDSSMVINGNGWNYELGTVSSNIANFKLYTSGQATISSGSSVVFGANGIPWAFNGTFWYSINGDTLTNFDDVRELIAASEPQLPFNWGYNFSSTITDSRPGVGLFRLNNATLANVTEIYIDYFDADGVAKNDFISMIDTGSSVSVITDENNYALYKATEGYIDNSNYFTYKVTYQSHSGVISGLSTIDLDISNSTGSGGGATAFYESINFDTGYAFNNDQILFGDPIVTEKAIFDSAQFASGSILTDIPQNDIYMWDSINSIITPYPIFESNSWYLGNTNPTGTTRLNLDYTLVPYNVLAIATSAVLGGAVVQGTFTGAATTSAGVRGVSSNGGIGVMAETVTSGGIALIAKSIASDVVNSAFIHNSDTILKITPDSLSGYRLDASFESIKINSQTLNGTTATDIIPSDSVIENTPINKLNFEEAVYTDHSKGRLYLDSATQGLILDDDISGKWNISSEVGDRFFNPTGTQINDGRIVRITGDTVFNGYHYAKVELAGNSSGDSTIVLGAATTNLPSLGFGRVTFLGRLNGLNTLGLSGTVYLGNAGFVIDTSPPPPAISVCLGQVPLADNDSGYMYFNPRMPIFDPNPKLSVDTSDLNQAVTINTQDVYEYIPLGDAEIISNFGFTIQGDSIQFQVSGDYQVVLSSSFQGNPTSETWHYGWFKDGVLQHKKTRTTASNAAGDINVPIERPYIVGDWLSAKIANTSGTGNPTIVDLAIQILFLNEQ